MSKVFIYIFLSCFVLFGFAPTGHAEKKESIPQTQKKLSDIEGKVKASEAEKTKLEQAATKIESDMKGLKTDLIRKSASVQKQERTLQDLEQKIAELQKQKDDMEGQLSKQRKSLADLIMALERIRRLPPETLIARPDAPLQTAQAATVLGSLLPEINSRAEKLKSDLEELATVEADLKLQKERAEKDSKALKGDKEKLDKLIAERSSTLKITKKEMEKKSSELAQLSKQAKNFRDLIKKLEKRQREQDARTASKTKTKSGYTGPALGTGHMPVSGTVKTHYGESDEIGATSQGLIFSSRPSSTVVAPLGGIVRYAGDFRNYGNIILIEHKNNFHSLVAGLGKIDTFEGQRLESGEPIGSLPSDSGRLYYELRYKGDPVNPSKKFSSLK